LGAGGQSVGNSDSSSAYTDSHPAYLNVNSHIDSHSDSHGYCKPYSDSYAYTYSNCSSYTSSNGDSCAGDSDPNAYTDIAAHANANSNSDTDGSTYSGAISNFNT
jgi:hypothetical protein